VKIEAQPLKHKEANAAKRIKKGVFIGGLDFTLPELPSLQDEAR
jgi:hypothetical protein